MNDNKKKEWDNLIEKIREDEKDIIELIEKTDGKMDKLGLYKFINDHQIEYHWHDDNVILFVPIYLLDSFNELFSYSHFDDGGIECRMLSGYMGFEMKDICDYYGIDMEDIFKPKCEFV